MDNTETDPQPTAQAGEACPECGGKYLPSCGDPRHPAPPKEYLKAHEPYEGSSVDFGSHRKPKAAPPTHDPIPPDGCNCASFWTIRGQHKSDCPLAPPTPSAGELKQALRDCVLYAAPAGTQEDGDFVGYYVTPTGPIHRAMALLGIEPAGDVANISRYQADHPQPPSSAGEATPAEKRAAFQKFAREELGTDMRVAEDAYEPASPQLPTPDTHEQLEQLADELGIYPPTNGFCGVCGERGFHHTCDQAFEAIQKALLSNLTPGDSK